MTAVELAAAVGGAAGVFQIAGAMRFYLQMREEFEVEPDPYSPPLSVVIACKGVSLRMRDCLDSLLRQDYPGESEYIFAVPSEEDPAVAVISSALACSGARGHIFASGLTPSRCSGQVLDILFALNRASAASSVIVFADADHLVAGDWLRRLVAPLAKSGRLTTSWPLFVPEEVGLCALLGSVYMNVGIAYSPVRGRLWGGSCALRRADFDAMGVAGAWRSALTHDLVLGALAKRHGLQVLFVGRALSTCVREWGPRSLIEQFNRWVLMCRVYEPLDWALVAGISSAKGAFLAWCLRPPSAWIPAAVFLLFEAVHLFVVTATFMRFAPKCFARLSPGYGHFPFAAACMAPLFWLPYLVNFAASLLTREVRWGGRVYLLRGPYDVEVRSG